MECTERVPRESIGVAAKSYASGVWTASVLLYISPLLVEANERGTQHVCLLPGQTKPV